MKDVFKFKVKDTAELYTARKETEDKYTIYAADTVELFSLPVAEVRQNIDVGIWVVETDNVNHPDHYQGKTEVIEIIEQLTEGMEGFKAYCLGNVAKYLFRHEKKGGIEDLKKARWYLNRVINHDDTKA